MSKRQREWVGRVIGVVVAAPLAWAAWQLVDIIGGH